MSTRPTRLGRVARWSIATLAIAVIAHGQVPEPKEITLLVASGAGGGLDLTARIMKSVLESEGLARVRIQLSPGAGGSVALAQLLSGHRGDGSTLLVGGRVLLSTAASQRLAISPLDATPIARLIGEYPIVVVPGTSPYRTMADLMAAVKVDTPAFAWAGGSSGSVYERLARDLYEAAGLSRVSLNYAPAGSSRLVSAALFNGRAPVGVSEAAAIEPYLAQGRLRPLAVAAPDRIPGLDIPTLKELGYDVVAPNWRGVFAGPGLALEDQDQLDTLISQMVTSRAWQNAIERRHLTDLYLGPIPFRVFVESEYADWLLPASASRLPSVADRTVPGSRLVWSRRTVFLVLALLASATLAWRLRAAGPLVSSDGGRPAGTEAPGRPASILRPPEGRADDPIADGEARDGGPERPVPDAGVNAQSVEQDEIARAFDTWGLTAAERDIAELMLQGLRYKQIAGHRGTSERTVRQQAQVILKKASLDGRADLAAYFLQKQALLPRAARRGGRSLLGPSARPGSDS